MAPRSVDQQDQKLGLGLFIVVVPLERRVRVHDGGDGGRTVCGGAVIALVEDIPEHPCEGDEENDSTDGEHADEQHRVEISTRCSCTLYPLEHAIDEHWDAPGVLEHGSHRWWRSNAAAWQACALFGAVWLEDSVFVRRIHRVLPNL